MKTGGFSPTTIPTLPNYHDHRHGRGMIRQRTSHDCGIAAMAMFTGKSYEEVSKAGIESEDWHPKKGMYSASGVLRWLGYNHENMGGLYKHPDTRSFRSIKFFEKYVAPNFVQEVVWGRPCMLSVPSLNVPGGWHFVYYDGQDVLDPQHGRRGKKSYTKLEDLIIREIVMWTHVE